MAAETAVTFLLEHVQAVLGTYGDLISGAEEEFKLLISDLGKLKDILKRPKEEQIREDVYEIQDTIDDLLAQGVEIKSKHGSRKFALGRLSTSSTSRFNLAKNVKSLREDKVKQVLQKAKTMTSADEPAGGTSAREHSETIEKVFDKVPPETVVGFEDEERILVGYLTEEKNKLDIISIIGMPGLGKSTLASKIFQDKGIRYEFPIRIWVHVSREFNFRDVCLKIMKTFTDGGEMSSMKDEELREAVRACLMEEKFLLVMDDVGSAKDWGEFKKVLPDDNGKGKVVITSREMGVGTYAKKITEPHMLRFLTGDESWELLQLEVFGDLQSCRGELEGIGRKIAEECGGVPLQIVVMGGILRHAPAEKNAWMEISKKVNRGDVSQANYMEKVMSDLLQLSYDRLPYDLREPFIYLGVFPPDYEIPTWTLTCLWIAEGLIPPKGNRRSFEETAKEYLDDLVDWNLLMVVRRNPMGEVKSCCVNGIIRSFCRVKAEKQHLFQEIKMSEREADHQVEYSNRRLCLYSHISTFFRRGVKGPHARSFLSFQMEHIKIDQEYNSTISNSFPLLRILHAGSTRFIEFPIKIVNLIHLRYIVLCVDDLQILPEAISHLWNLQTIVVDTMSRTLTMEANIWRMIWLRHLKTRAKIVLGDKWQGEGGRNLQTVSRLSASSTEAICERASNLKTLAIRGELAKLFNMSLQNLKNLENLKLENDLMHEPASENPLHLFLKPNSFPESLTRLTLSNTYLDWKHMRAVAGIGSLKVLKLKNNAFSGLSWDAVDYVIILEYLLIADANLVLWEASTRTFPSLRCLVLKNCENLKEIPASISESLLKIQVDGVRKSAVESARKIEEHLRNSKPGNRFQLSVGYSK